MTVVTIYALFFDDIRILFLPPSADLTCDWVTLICIILYTVELLLGCVAIDGYFLSPADLQNPCGPLVLDTNNNKKKHVIAFKTKII